MNIGYKERRESGIPWLGALPAHWKPAKLKYIADIINGATPDSGNDSYWDGDIVWITPSDLGKLTTAYVSDSKRRISEAGFKSCGTSMVPADTVIMTTRAPIGNSCITTVEVCFNQGCKALVLRDGDNKFVYYQLVGYRPYLEMLGSGSTFMELSTDKFKDFVLPVPPLPEQRAIAAYLDHKTAQLDTLLAQKETLLRLLHQKRQALINEAVTQGLDPAVPRKPSGVAWLGDVPAHWGVKRLKHVMDFFNTVRVPLSAEERGLMTNPVYDYYGASGAIDKVDNYHFDGEYILLAEDGANLLSRSSPLAFKATGKFWVNNHAHILKPKDGNLDYYVNLLESLDYSIYVTGSAQPKLTMGNLAGVSLPIPPVEEQNEIQKYLHRISSQLMNVENQIHNQIKTLKAYRQSLISEVVTGKVDVRTEAQALIGAVATPSLTKQASQPAPAHPEAVGQLNLF